MSYEKVPWGLSLFPTVMKFLVASKWDIALTYFNYTNSYLGFLGTSFFLILGATLVPVSIANP